MAEVAVIAPEHGIDKIPDMLQAMHEMQRDFDSDAAGVVSDWIGLIRVGGQRSDHAAVLLSRLRPHLEKMTGFMNRVDEQISVMLIDPFGRKAAEKRKTR